MIELGTLRAIAVLAISALLAITVPELAGAHSASDAYLTLTYEGSISTGRSEIHGQWDISLRDLDFVLKLDDDGDGRVTWGEMRNHQAAIEGYVYRYLQVEGGAANKCSIKPRRQMIDDHADGAYVALFFDVICASAPKKLTVHYNLFFAIDPSHRGIFLMKTGANVATALLAPENAKIDLVL